MHIVEQGPLRIPRLLQVGTCVPLANAKVTEPESVRRLLQAPHTRQVLNQARRAQSALSNKLAGSRQCIVSFPDPAPLRGKKGLGTLVDFLGILCVSNHVTHAYVHAHFSNKRVIRELRIVSCPGGGVWVAVTREFERDNCVISEILQSDWTITNRAGVPRKSTKVPRPSFVRESREGLGPRLGSADLSTGLVAVVSQHRQLVLLVFLPMIAVIGCSIIYQSIII